jgi:acetylornithine/succinyldiaminopimelate/putrescine aminotransferase
MGYMTDIATMDGATMDGATSVAKKPAYNKLLHAISPLANLHPERTGATLARVKEVLDLAISAKTHAGIVFIECKNAAGEGIGYLDSMDCDSGAAVAGVLEELLAPDELEKVTELLEYSEISTDEVIALHKKFKIPVSHLEDDLLPVKGDGAKIYDSKGKVYVDLDSNYSATNLGNANAEIGLGLYNQASLLVSQKEDRIQVARARFLKEVDGMLPKGLDCFYWQNSGGEAVDKAIKIAKAYTGQTGVIAFEGGFHGRTHGAAAVTHNVAYRKPFGLHDLDWVHFAPFNDIEAVEEILAAGKAKIVILEVVQGEEAGIRPVTKKFAEALRPLCDKYGAVIIVDEVQSGFGRTSNGEGMWFACQVYGIDPDIITIGKSFGGGYPVTAVVTKPKISQAMKGGYDGSTFGGNPMAMTSALIAIKQMKALNLTVVAAERSKQFHEGLSKISSPCLKSFRTIGLFIGLDLPSPVFVTKMQKIMMKNGVHTSLSTGSMMRWLPPLVITEKEVETVLAAFEKALMEVQSA